MFFMSGNHRKKTAGIIGGLGPESTIDYYRLILARYQERRPDGTSPSLIISSLDLNRVRGLFDIKAYDEITSYLAEEIERLALARADFAILSANSVHLVFDDVQKRSRIPLISIVEATCANAEARGLRKLGLLGTRFTMEGTFFHEVFARRNIGLVAPSLEERDYIHDRYFGELVKGIFLPETRDRMLAITNRLRSEHQIDGVILAGTELPLLLRDAPSQDIPFLDTTQIHVDAVVERLLED